KGRTGQGTSGCPSLHAASPSSQPEFCLSSCLSSECPPTFCCHQSPKALPSEGWKGSLGSGIWPQTRECTLRGRASVGEGGFPSLKRPSQPSDCPQTQVSWQELKPLPHSFTPCGISWGSGIPLRSGNGVKMRPWCCRRHPDTYKFTPTPQLLERNPKRQPSLTIPQKTWLVNIQLREKGTGA
ncbi:uncharacterized protein LOC126931027, partial [Macaca thibetana thibetana]|uniref:uncharacterized protein LOC126931027 n=1 Tax=Macaca thibetana thibetana TaxID=257877 RepID=UPI0021BC9B23